MVKLHLKLINLIGVIVPRRLRADWRQEWESELRYRETMLEEWERLDWRAKLDLLRRSMGAFRDALWMQSYRWEDEMFQDLRFSLRMMLKSKGLTAMAVLSLALGIGANTALFSIADAVLFKTLPVSKPEQLILLNWLAGPKMPMGMLEGHLRQDQATGRYTSSSFSYLTYQQFQAQAQTLAEVFAFAPVDQLNVNAGDQAEISSGQLVSGNYHSGLGVSALLGRTIEQDDDQAAASPVAVLSHRYWQSRFGSDPSIIGKSIRINDVAFTIIGVTPPDFFGTLDIGEDPDLSLPLSVEPQIRQGETSNLNEPWNWWLRVMGRMEPGVTYEQVRAELEVVLNGSALEGWDAYPAEKKTGAEDKGARDPLQLGVEPGSRGLNNVRKEYAWPLEILQFVVGLVLLIACANVANLLLARSAIRQKELAVRLALGATRFRLLRQLLTESLLLSFLGGVLGVVFAYWARDFLVLSNPWSNGVPALALNLDMRVLGFTMGVSLLTGLLFGIVPSLYATKVDVSPALKEGARSLSRGSRSLLSKSLIVFQVAMSLVLLIGAGLFINTLRNLQAVDVGFNHDNLLLFRVDPRLNNYKQDQIGQLYDKLVDRLSALPGVRSVTLARHPLLSGSSAINGINVQGQLPRSGREGRVWVQRTSANFFDTLEIPLLAGRSLTSEDDQRSPKVAIVNQTFARKFFVDENPLGHRFGFGSPSTSSEIEIVGIVKDAFYTGLRDGIPPTVYVPYLQQSFSQMNFAVRTEGDPSAFIPAIREAVRQVDRDLPLFDVKSQNTQIEESLTQERMFARLTTVFALLALLLASIGLYGVLAFSVAQRTREIGIRMALGAGKRNVLMLVIRQGLTLVVFGVVLGLLIAFNLTHLIESLLFDVQPTHVWTFVSVALLLMAVALVACYVPARRATKTDPLVALRYE